MSNKQNLPSSKVSFDLAVNLHYGALHLLLRSFELLRDAGCVSRSEFERFQKFMSFVMHLIMRGYKRYYPEISSEFKSFENEHSQS